MSELLEKIRSRGYWKVVIHPAHFDAKRVPSISDLYPILEKTSVQLGGWDFPHLDTPENLQIDAEWVGQDIHQDHFLELWRFYQSGQFIHYSAIRDDWRDQSQPWPAPADWNHGVYLGVYVVLFKFAEVFEFASRLALTTAGDEEMHLEVTACGLKGRTLWVDPARWPGWDMFSHKLASVPKYLQKIDVSRIDLVTEPRELALKPARELFRRFGWDPNLEVLRDLQEQMLGRRSNAQSVSP